MKQSDLPVLAFAALATACCANSVWAAPTPNLTREPVSFQATDKAQLYITSSNINGPGPLPLGRDGLDINALVGANRFYNAGFTGTQTILANVEAGHIHNGHELLTHAGTRITGTGALNQTDNHATNVGHALGGRESGNYAVPNTLEKGMAYGATLWSGAVATSYGSGGSFTASDGSVASTYAPILKTGVGAGSLKANVFNSSWGNSDPYGVSTQIIGLDGLINQTGVVGVVAAGNAGPGTNTVTGFAAGYNTISVGALGSDLGNPAYSAVSSFSSRSPTDTAFPGTPTSYLGAYTSSRARVDITAPGQNLTLAAYAGFNGYNTNAAGTSFAAPIVAGGAALVVDAGKTLYSGNSRAIDGRVVKAVLLNGADKLSGWNNGQVVSNGIVTTEQSLDYAVGAGRMNLSNTFDNYVSITNGGDAGTTDVAGTTQGDLGSVGRTGWDFGNVVPAVSNLYFIDTVLTGGSTLTATLTWFADRNPGSDTDFTGAGEQHLADMDLLVFQYDNPTNRNILGLIGQSISTFNNTEHLSFALPSSGYYGIAVDYYNANWNFTGETSELYGLAWTSVPEPASAMLILLVAPLITRRRSGRA